MMNRILLEVCIETVADAKAAFKGGADRLEVCSRLDLGGLTPNRDEFLRIREAVPLPLPLLVMLRPRGGDFVYSESELIAMRTSLEEFLPLRPAGFVLGIQQSPPVATSGLIALIHAAGLQSVFHRAFDEVPDQFQTLEELIALGFTRVLTSGCHRTAFEGRERIAELNRLAHGRIEILPGAGVRPENAVEILRSTGCRQIHGSFSTNGRTDTVVVRAVRTAIDQFAAMASG